MILGSSTPAHRYSSSTWLVTPVGRARDKKMLSLLKRTFTDGNAPPVARRAATFGYPAQLSKEVFCGGRVLNC